MRYLVTIFLALFIVCKPDAFGQFTPAPVVISQQTTVRNGDTFYVHKVEKYQTIFSICKTYGIASNTLIEDNPEIQNGLRTGDTIYVRKAVVTQKKYINHIVRWYENLAAIAKKYNVTEESIIKLNSLEGNLIKVRQVLKIPQDEGVTQSEEIVQSEVERTTVKQAYDVSLVLPVGSNNTLNQDGNNNYLDFYQGFLLALEDLKEEGMSVNLKVFDLSDYSTGTLLAQTGKLEGSEIIIGPIFMNEVEPVLEYASQRGIPLVSPMDPKTETLIEGHPKFYQVSSNPYSQQVDLLKNISANSYVTLIYESSNHDAALVDMTKEILNSRGIRFSSLSYNVLSGRSISPQIAGKLSKVSMNNVIVASNSEAFVSDVLRNLNLLSSRSNYKITLYGTPRWRNFESVDFNYYHSMNLHLSLQYYIDYTEEIVKRFLARYRALYGSEPTPYSFQAYDVAYYFLGALYHFGPDFSERIERYSRELLQTDLRFVKKGENNGFINNTTRQVIYNPDYSIDISRLNR
ncbi:MAG: LysM peptidoglycan-binding domain-containing protein [Bacteroidales bacterium]